MNSSDLHLRRGLRLAALLFALVAAPCRADDVPVPLDDTNAYQLLQLLNQNETLSAEISNLRGQIEELVEGAQRARQSQQKIAVDFDTSMQPPAAAATRDFGSATSANGYNSLKKPSPRCMRW